MNSREEAAVKAWDHYWGDRYGDEAMDEMGEEVAVALEAADAHDAAHGVHRVSLDQLTKAIYEVDPLKFFGDDEPVPWEKLGPAWRLLAKDKAKAALAAAAGGDGE